MFIRLGRNVVISKMNSFKIFSKLPIISLRHQIVNYKKKGRTRAVLYLQYCPPIFLFL